MRRSDCAYVCLPLLDFLADYRSPGHEPFAVKQMQFVDMCNNSLHDGVSYGLGRHVYNDGAVFLQVSLSELWEGDTLRGIYCTVTLWTGLRL